MSLDECAHGLAQLNAEVQRNTDAYRYFTHTIAMIEKASAGVPLTDAERLPFIPFRFATTSNDGAPGEYKLDLNTIPTDELVSMKPMFTSLLGACADDLVAAWEHLIELVNIVRPQIEDARNIDE